MSVTVRSSLKGPSFAVSHCAPTNRIGTTFGIAKLPKARSPTAVPTFNVESAFTSEALSFGFSAALSAAALGSLGAFDVAAPVAPPPQHAPGNLDDRGKPARDEPGAVFYLVSSQAEAIALEAAIARDWHALDPSSQADLSVGVFDVSAPGSRALIEMLTGADWTAELGRQVTVVDLRDTSYQQ